ncbi:hypothetical protein Avbf_09433 [Armadillidium vulgare]|nr:hypothetical protein Avbf_09433 [Armadillidium vulgare]
MEFIMDIKTEVEIKDEIEESLEDVKDCNQYFGQELELDQIQMMKADDDDWDNLSDNRSIKEEIGETELLAENDDDMEEDESSFEDEEEFEGFIHSDNFKERSNLLNKMILQLRNLQSTLLKKFPLLLSFRFLLQNYARVYIHPSFKSFIGQS